MNNRGRGGKNGPRPQTAHQPSKTLQGNPAELDENEKRNRKRNQRKFEKFKNPNDKPRDFFEERKAANEELTQNGQALDFDQLQENMNAGVRKMGMMGSAQANLDNKSQKQPKNPLKAQFINPEDRKKKNMKDKATVKYNFEDFLKQSQNVSEQCKHFVETLSTGKQECIICANPIF